MELKIDLHVHTNASPDGRSSLGALAAAALAQGLDGMAIADHNRFTLDRPERYNGVLLLPACEISTDRGHMLALFCAASFDVQALMEGGLVPAAVAARAIHEAGGLAVMAHPFARADRDLEDLAPLLDGVECANARACFKNPAANAMAAEYAARRHLPYTGGSDAHHAREVGNCYTLFQAESADPAHLAQALKAGDTRAVFVRPTPRYRKGLSQMTRARRSHNPLKVCRGAAYLAYCGLRDLLRV